MPPAKLAYHLGAVSELAIAKFNIWDGFSWM